MRLLLCTSIICVLTACQTVDSTDEINFHAPVKAEWRLVEMKGLEDAYNRDLRPVDKPLSGPERLRSLKLVTKTHREKPDLEIVEFQACNKIRPLEGFDANSPLRWFGAGGFDNWCGEWMHYGGIGNEDMHHRVFKLFYAAENQFVELIVQVETRSMSSDPNVLELRDADNTVLMRFTRREAAE